MENNLSISKRRLLLADDSTTIQKVVNLTFAGENIEVVTVSDGDAAMRKFVEVEPDLVMADVNMPGLNGYQICEKIKQDARTKRIPVILLVGSFEPFDEEKAIRVGANDYLTKPFQSILQLVNKVSELLDAGMDADDFLAPIENSHQPVNSFADTLKMMPTDEFDSADVSIENLGDAGMDDEMIQTAQIGSVPTDEAHKYESSPVYQSFAEDLDENPLNPSYNSDVSADYPPHDDWAKIQSLSKEEFEETRDETGKDKSARVLEFDDIDLLDFPQTKKLDDFSETFSSPDSEISDKEQDAFQGKASEISDADIEYSAASTQTNNLSS
jgi:CheY-like chemotaxis protein